MCGICGCVSVEADRTFDPALTTMTKAMVHRGPNSEGHFKAPHIHLRMRRLSIMDLEGGDQPLYNEDRSIVVVANGEVYNAAELRSRLILLGHHLSTMSDCEVIAHLYETYGDKCVEHLRGMFAFALWDTRRRRLLLARDRMGEKPLYLLHRDGQVVFASEMKSLLASGLIDPQLDPVAINHFFHYQFVPEPRTALCGVTKLDAGHTMTVEIEPWRVETRRYWSMLDAPPIYADPTDAILEELDRIGQLVVRADVSVGVALSGGLDSSVLAVLASRARSDSVHAFTVGYQSEWRSDEREEAKALADHLKMPFHSIELTQHEMVDFFPELVIWQDDPIADIAGFGYYAVSRAAREAGVPVLLQGQGGDELFWGYSWVKLAARLTRTRASICSRLGKARYLSVRPPTSLSRPAIGHWVRTCGGLRSGWRAIQRHRGSPDDQMFFYDFAPDFPHAAGSISAYYTPSFRDKLTPETGPHRIFATERPWPAAGIALTELICRTYLRENGIAQCDRLSMASSVELRLPLVDYRLVETAIGLRKAACDLDLPNKARWKTALAKLLPEWVINRPKRGFAPPIRAWHHAIFAKYGSTLRDGYLVQSGVLTPEAASTFAHGDFPRGHVAPLSFKALVLELWCRQL